MHPAILIREERDFFVIPAKAGIQEKQSLMDLGFRRGDGFDEFLGVHEV